MPHKPPSHPYVDSVSMSKDGNQIALAVEVTDFVSSGGMLEISGQATQVNGAFANISAYVDVAEAAPGDNADATGDGTAEATPDTTGDGTAEATPDTTGDGAAEATADATGDGAANAADNDKKEMFVTVTADIARPTRFTKDLDVTVFVRVAKVWVSVLGQPPQAVGPAKTVQNGDATTTWNTNRGVTQVTGQTWATTPSAPPK